MWESEGESSRTRAGTLFSGGDREIAVCPASLTTHFVRRGEPAARLGRTSFVSLDAAVRARPYEGVESEMHTPSVQVISIVRLHAYLITLKNQHQTVCHSGSNLQNRL